MIYNCTMFFNEFKLLELKIAEELNQCDRLIIVESSKTHSNNDKLLHLKDHSLIDDPKITYKSDIGDYFVNNHVVNEGLQRDSALWEIDLQDDDIVICSDVDEIHPAESFDLIIRAVKEYGFVKIVQDLYYYKINLRTPTLWHSSFAVTGKFLKENHGQLTMLRRDAKAPFMVRTNGKHFSYLGTPEEVFYKVQNFMHYEYEGFADLEEIRRKMENHKDIYGRLYNHQEITFVPVEIDDTYPKTILNNLLDWGKYIEPHK